MLLKVELFLRFEENMAQEILAAIRKKGNAYNKRIEMCKDINESRANFAFC
jgi:ribosomal protein S7